MSIRAYLFDADGPDRGVRVVFDGRGEYLSLERVVVADGSKVVAEWQSIHGKPLRKASFESLLSEVCALLGSE